MEKKCEFCGKEFDSGKGIGDCCSEKCFSEQFWSEVLDDTAVIVDGCCYHIGPENDDVCSCFKGHGGATFVIYMISGDIVKTTNLWSQGKIPKKYKMKDNAKFVGRFVKRQDYWLQKFGEEAIDMISSRPDEADELVDSVTGKSEEDIYHEEHEDELPDDINVDNNCVEALHDETGVQNNEDDDDIPF